MFEFDYSYLDWGLGIRPTGDAFMKEATHVETEALYGLDLIQENVDVDFGEDEKEDRDDYNLLFLAPHISEGEWGSEDENRIQRRHQILRQIKDLKAEIKPGHIYWNRFGGQFLDMFLLEEGVENVHGTKYDSVLLMMPDPENNFPVAIIWEMVPEDKRDILINLQRGGAKIFASFSENIKYKDEGFLCLDIYILND